ncbi:LLM class F420-dependent oxidoreductase [Planosporangium mesophilum]|uniref:LLM class F420-dependent oxidoreductase n=1 Tax=Planosporangium mesophilum TaxID=689768 RepID=A0A8J3X2C7_9ACTN|nr:LLM class F420-dependent oxidoreductase [Planosporangium mesophilum]NJC83403.1 LLM class F420-dependent oxidoreductase [Planosporangium mesophilum]GII21783.1 LLM class F420-dependent oxidoreductase [Planosporangium mesophilum]
MRARWGLTVPLTGVPLISHRPLLDELADAGYTDLWSSEVAGTDAFTPLALASTWSPTLRLGTAIAPVFTRGPGLLAMTAATMAEAAPDRFVLGIGASSPVVVEDWNAQPYRDPFGRTRDTLRFLKRALAGELVDEEYPTFAVRRFKLERPPASPPPILLAALRAGMLRLAAAEADGVILNWLAADDLPRVRAELAGAKEGFETVARIFVCPTDDERYARELGRRMIAGYLTVPAYAAFHRWLGRSDVLEPMWTAWAAGDRRAATAAIPDEVVDALILHGNPQACRAKVEEYVRQGVQTPVIALLPTPELATGSGGVLRTVLLDLAPPVTEV